MYDPKIMQALKTFHEVEIPDDFPKSMPLLDVFRQRNKRSAGSLNNLNILLIQHHLSPYILRLDALFKEGLNPENTWIIDIPYSTNEIVRREIPKRFGIPTHQIATPFRDPIAPYSIMQLQRVESIVYQLAGRIMNSKLLVIDDGAYFVRALRDIDNYDKSIVDAFRGRTFLVEQTTRGHRYLEEAESKRLIEERLKAPVISIARCKTKTEFEAPFIGEAAARDLTNALGFERIDLNDLDAMAIIGFGPVGQAVFQALKRLKPNTSIQIIDTKESKHQEIIKLGGNPLKQFPMKGKYDLVVGCTGYKSFNLKDWNSLSSNAYLVSTSSAAVEFNRKQFVDLAELYPDDEIEIVNKNEIVKNGIHTSLRIRDSAKQKQVTFINASFPVNFDGKMECLPLRYIQATHTLLYAAGYQALETIQPGLKSINSKIDNEIFANALEFI